MNYWCSRHISSQDFALDRGKGTELFCKLHSINISVYPISVVSHLFPICSFHKEYSCQVLELCKRWKDLTSRTRCLMGDRNNELKMWCGRNKQVWWKSYEWGANKSRGGAGYTACGVRQRILHLHKLSRSQCFLGLGVYVPFRVWRTGLFKSFFFFSEFSM